jgi:two-component system, response regulator YesN
MEHVILVVDDEKLTREGIAATLRDRGLGTVLLASNARDALFALKERRGAGIDLLITDVRMPMMDGLELLAELERSQIILPTIVVSAHSDFGYAQKAIHYGVFEYILKPIDPAQLLRAAEKALGDSPVAKARAIELPDILQDAEFLEAIPRVWTPSIRAAVDYVIADYAKAPSVREVADAVGLNPSYFSTLFKEKTGYTFGDFLLQVRMWHAKKLLVTTDDKVYEIAQAVGYTTARYFAKAFHETAGMSPAEFRCKYRPGATARSS